MVIEGMKCGVAGCTSLKLSNSKLRASVIELKHAKVVLINPILNIEIN
jgi:hypothetical protein